MAHPIAALGQHDPAGAALLAAHGIATVEQLLQRASNDARLRSLARRLGVPHAQVREWVAWADLLRIGGVDAALSGLLIECGVHSCAELQHRVAANLYAAIKTLSEARRLAEYGLSLAQVEAWVIEAAILMAGGGR